MAKRLFFVAAAGALLLTGAAGAQDDDDLGAEPETYVRPAYPAGVDTNASCAAFFNVEPEGGVDMLSLTVTCTNPAFAPSVKDALAQWRFAPTLVDGQPVAMFGYSARITFTGGSCARVASGNFIDTPCALAQD